MAIGALHHARKYSLSDVHEALAVDIDHLFPIVNVLVVNLARSTERKTSWGSLVTSDYIWGRKGGWGWGVG